MSEPRKFTLAESLEARDALTKEVSNMLGVAWMDVYDTTGQEYEEARNVFWEGDRQETWFSKKFARMLVERLLWSREYGLILDYDPEADRARFKAPTSTAAQIFSSEENPPSQPIVKPVPEIHTADARDVVDYWIDFTQQHVDDHLSFVAECGFDGCDWETDGSEPVVEEAAHEHAETHVTKKENA